MKVGIIFPMFFPIGEDMYRFYQGLEGRTYAVAKYLAKRGYEVHVFACRGSSVPESSGLHLHTGNYGMYDPRSGVHAYDMEKDLILENLHILKTCDVVIEDNHFHYYHFLRGGKQPMLFSWDHHPDNLRSLPPFRCNIVCVSKWLRSALRAKFGGDKHNFIVAYSGLNLDIMPPKQHDTIENTWLYLARFSYVKGAHIVVELAKRYPDDQFVLIGDVLFTQEPAYAWAIKQASEKWKNLKVIFNATWDEKIYWLQSCQGLLHTSRWEEPMGISLLEAMFYGKPVLAFFRGASPELIKDGVHGMLVQSMPQQDVENYAKAFKKFREMEFNSKVIQQHVRRNFNFMKHSAPKYEDFIKRIVEEWNEEKR